MSIYGAGHRGLHPDAAEKVKAGHGGREGEPPRDRPVGTAPQQAASDQRRGRTPNVHGAPVESRGEVHHRRLHVRDVEQQEHVHRGEARPVDRVEETHHRSAVRPRRDRRERICAPIDVHLAAAHALPEWTAVAYEPASTAGDEAVAEMCGLNTAGPSPASRMALSMYAGKTSACAT